MYQVTLKNVEANTIIHAVSSEKNAPKINGTLKKGINVIDEFTFKIKPNNVGFNLIRPFKTLIEVLNTKNNTIEFIGRVLMPVPSMGSDGVIESTVVCESELAYLHDTNTRHGEFHDISVEDFLKMLINNHNAHTTEDKWFEVGKVEVIDKIYRFTSYDQTTFESIKDNLLDRLGGEILIRYENNKRYLDYVLQAGKKSSVDIRLSKNLVSFTREVDPTQVATRAIGYGSKKDNSEERINFKDINNGKDYVDDEEAIKIYGIIEKTFIYDDVTLPENLLRKVKDKQKEVNRNLVKHQISAVDLFSIGLEIESFDVYNVHRFINPMMGIDEELRIIEKSIDINEPQSSKLMIGDKFETLRAFQNKTVLNEKNINKVQNTVNSTVQVVAGVNSTLNNTVNSLNDTINILNNTNINVADINTALQENIRATIEVTEKVAKVEKDVIANTEKIDKLKRRCMLGVW